MYVIMPAYEPDEKMIGVVNDLMSQLDAQLIIVDDGSGEAYRSLFHIAQKKGATVLTHPKNQGKGAALKTAFQYIANQPQPYGPELMVTIDCDGQHLVADMLQVAHKAHENPDSLVLGVRAFTGKVPARSKFGNKVTSLLFRLTTGVALSDTQTGLRAFNTDMIDWLLQVEGDRFEYEFNMLLGAKGAGYQLAEVPIETVYIEENKSSHFRPLQDSARIYMPFIKFSGTALLASAVDVALLLFFMMVTSSLLFSIVAARLVSSLVQYTTNADLVFKQGKSITSMLRYFTLMLALLVCNYVMMTGLLSVGITLLLAKLLTETVLFIASYRFQQNFVYRT